MSCRRVIACAGLHADTVAQLSGCAASPAILPVRGEYLILRPEKQYLVRGNIYPVGSAAVPFLGVHFTPRLDGSVWLGPNAVVAFAKEGYSTWTVQWRELWDIITFAGFRKLALSFFVYGATEMYRSLSVAATVRELNVSA